MAREVYFDPYGSYTRGYDQGTSRQMEVERGARDARTQDLDFYGFAPLRLENAQLETNFNNAAYQPRVNALGYADITGRNAAAQSMLDMGSVGSFTGNPQPFANALQYLYGYQQQQMPDGSIQMVTKDGQPAGVPITTGGISEPWYRRNEFNARNDTYFDQGLGAFNAQTQAQNANTQLWQAQAYAQNMDNQTRATLAGQAAKAGGAGAFEPWNAVPRMFGTTLPGLASPTAYNYPAAAPRTPASMAPQPSQVLPPAYGGAGDPAGMFAPQPAPQAPQAPQQPEPFAPATGPNAVNSPMLSPDEVWADYQQSIQDNPNHPMPNLTPGQVMAMYQEWAITNGLQPIR